MNESDFIQEARERFEESETDEQKNRDRYDYHVRFENGDQWSDKELEDRAGRPCMKDNRVAGAVKQILGDARMNRPRIKVRPVDSASDPMTAEIYNGIIRNIENVSNAEEAYDNGHDNAVRGGYGYWRVNIGYPDDETTDMEIMIERIVNPLMVYFDQSSIKHNYEDAEYCFVAENIPHEKFKRRYPKAALSDWEGGDRSSWLSRETVRVAEYWYKEPCIKHLYKLATGETIEIKKPEESVVEGEGMQPVDVVRDGDGEWMHYIDKRDAESHKIMQALISGVEILDGPKEWKGKYIPIIPCLGEEVWIDGERILRSAIHHAVDPQKILNWNVSNDIETKALAPKQPWLVTKEQLGEFKGMWDMAYVKPMPYLLWNFVPGQPTPQRLTGSISDTGAIQGIAMAVDSVKAATGIFDASLGSRSNETSGVAIERRQRQGSVATFVFTDNQVRAVKHTGVVLVDLIPKVLSNDRVVRLMGDDLRKPFKEDEVPAPHGEPLVKVSHDGLDAMARINFDDPITGRKYNDLSLGKYDVVIDAGPGYVTRRQEASDGMMRMAEKYPPTMPVLLPRIAKNADWPDSDDLGDELKQIFQPPQQEGPDPKDQIAMQKGQIDLQKGQLDVESKKLDLAGKAQDLQAEAADDEQRMVAIAQQVAQQVVAGVLQELGVIR